MKLPIMIASTTLCCLGAVLVVTNAERQSRLGNENVLTVEDYVPRSTLVVDVHEVPRARFPVVDVHSHHWPGLTVQRWEEIVSEMDSLNLQVLVNLSGGSGRTIQRGVEMIKGSRHPDRMVFFSNIDFLTSVEGTTTLFL